MNLRYQFLTLLLSSMPLVALAEVYEMPADGNDVIGALTTVTAREADTLLDIARRHGLGYEDIVRANAIISVPVNPKFASLNLGQCVLLAA